MPKPQPVPPGTAPSSKLFDVHVLLKGQQKLVDQKYALVPKDVFIQMETALAAFQADLNANPPAPATQPEVKPRVSTLTLSLQAEESHKAGLSHPSGNKKFASAELSWSDIPWENAQEIQNRLQAGLAAFAQYVVKVPMFLLAIVGLLLAAACSQAQTPARQEIQAPGGTIIGQPGWQGGWQGGSIFEGNFPVTRNVPVVIQVPVTENIPFRLQIGGGWVSGFQGGCPTGSCGSYGRTNVNVRIFGRGGRWR